MASNDLKQRVAPTSADTTTNTMKNEKRRGTRRDKAKRGLKSLAIALTFPLSLSLISSYLSSSMHSPVTSSKPFWFPPSWALHLTCPASSFLTGLSAWMVWADGGFHTNPTVLLLYLTQLLLTLLWEPVVFGAGATRFGLILSFGLFGSLFACMRVFRRVNPIAADLIKPCLAWVGFLSVVNIKLLFA